jgi:hypothetical protein
MTCLAAAGDGYKSFDDDFALAASRRDTRGGNGPLVQAFGRTVHNGPLRRGPRRPLFVSR